LRGEKGKKGNKEEKISISSYFTRKKKKEKDGRGRGDT